MNINVFSPAAQRVELITLNGRPVECMAASDTEGWVDVVDIASMAPLDLTSDLTAASDKAFTPDGEPAIPPTSIKTKRIYGKVVIKLRA